jgi:poly(3-hydroxybutyrate) depolymerase
VKEIHDQNTAHPWVSYIPCSAFLPENRNRKYPYLFQVNFKNDLLAEGYGHAYVCAEDEVILVYPLVSSSWKEPTVRGQEGRTMPKASDYWPMIDKSVEELPVDKTRMYVTGFSFPGFRAVALALERPGFFAALLLNAHLFPYIWDLPDQDAVQQLRKYKLPIINIAGMCDYGHPYPVYHAQHQLTNNGHDHDRTSETAMTRPNFWFQVNDCPEISLQEALATKSFDDSRMAERTIGLPSMHAGTMKVNDTNHHFADFESRDGVIRTRLVAVENCPHWMHGGFARMQWEFCRHFSRDAVTHESVWDGIAAPFGIPQENSDEL